MQSQQIVYLKIVGKDHDYTATEMKRNSIQEAAWPEVTEGLSFSMAANIHVPLQWPWVKALILNGFTDFSGRISVQNPLWFVFVFFFFADFS